MKNALTLAQSYIKLVKKSGIPVAKAYLYGSYAKKNQDKDSDIDICVVSPIFGKNYTNENIKLRMLTLDVDTKIEPVAFNPSDMANKYDSLAIEIQRTGVII